MNHLIFWARVLCVFFITTLATYVFANDLSESTLVKHQKQYSIEDFRVLPSSHFVTLSPDGKKIAWIYATDAKSIRQLKVLDLQTNTVSKVLASPHIRQLIWHNSSESIYALSDKTLLFLPLDAKKPRKTLLKFDKSLHQKFVKYDENNNTIYFSEEDEQSHRIFGLNSSGEKSLIIASKERVKNFYHFPNNASLFYTLEFNDHAEIFASEKGVTRSLRSCDMVKRCGLLGVNLNQRMLFIDTNSTSKTDSISSLHLDTLEETLLMVDPENISDRETTKLKQGNHIFTSFFGNYRRFYSPEISVQKTLDLLADRFPQQNLTLDVSQDLSTWLIEVNAGNMQLPGYYTYNSSTNHLANLTAIIEDKTAKIDESDLAKPTPLTYKSRDGLNIQSYVWLPQHTDLKTAPLITFVHGGPWKRLKGEYDPIVQLLVDNGYIVFQPNFRASWGFGVDFIIAGAKTFGKGKTHNDIIDGIEFLLAKGMGHREKLGIFGHSFGGFSVLGALAFEPDYFKAGFASAPPAQMLSFNTDETLKKMGRKRPIRGFDRLYQDRVFLFDERNQAEVDYLNSISPDAHKMSIKTPLIIAAGGRDRKVPAAGVKRYALALKRGNKPISFFFDKNANHSFNWQPTWAPLLFLMEGFFATHLGGNTHKGENINYKKRLQEMAAFSTPSVGRLYQNPTQEAK